MGSMIDLERLAEQAQVGVVPILEGVLAKGVPLYGGDGHGNLVEIAPTGRKYLVEFRGTELVRVREIPVEPVDSR
jgi:hypothetical protein